MSAMMVVSAFGDEISPDLREQLHVLTQCQVFHLELRSLWGTNVLDLSADQRREARQLLADYGVKVSAIGSPIGKVKVNDSWPIHLERFKLALERAHEFATPLVRIFSFYPAGDGPFDPAWRSEILARLNQMTEMAAAAGITLVHENEHRIYGEPPERVRDLLTTINHPHLRAVCDPGNYVHGGFDPWQGWEQTREWTVHFHIKDWVRGETHGRLAGMGQGRIGDILADAGRRGYRGYVVLEPHLRGGGPTGGYTGPDLFPAAVAALRGLLPAGVEVETSPAG